MNEKYIEQVRRDTAGRAPKFRLGQKVSSEGREGVVDSVYANYASVVNVFVVPDGWYEMQEPPLRTPKSGFFYGVTLLERGAVLAGEDDLEGRP